MQLSVRTKLVPVIVILFALMSSLMTSSPAGAELYPDYYPKFRKLVEKGDTIAIEACLPKNVKSPMYLQSDNPTPGKNLVKITFKTLKYDKSCATEVPRAGNYRLKSYWKVNVTGEHSLTLYAPNLETSFNLWPDIVRTYQIGASQPTASTQDVILNQPAANFFIPGSALITLQQVWGISLNSTSGPKSFRQVADEIYLYLCRSIGGKVTQTDLVVGFQPGNSMQSFFSRLITNALAYQAMKDRLIYNSNQ